MLPFSKFGWSTLDARELPLMARRTGFVDPWNLATNFNSAIISSLNDTCDKGDKVNEIIKRRDKVNIHLSTNIDQNCPLYWHMKIQRGAYGAYGRKRGKNKGTEGRGKDAFDWVIIHHEMGSNLPYFLCIIFGKSCIILAVKRNRNFVSKVENWVP